MRHLVFRMYRRLARFLAAPLVAESFLRRSTGLEYGIGLCDKCGLTRQMRRITDRIIGATGYGEHLLLASYLLSISPSVPGVVVECGCFKGRSTATLSLLCEMTNRQLIVFDSFEGLPDVAADDRAHVTLLHDRYEVYKKGDYTGTLDEVQAHVREFGCIDRCRFIKGYFEDSLPHFHDPAAFVFLDVDLHESLKTCLRYLWPLLHDQGYLFTHEATQLDFAAKFFDRDWWRREMACEPPGLVGAGCGLPSGIATGSGLGYTRKRPLSGLTSGNRSLSEFCGDPTQICNKLS